jgi:23S rRNA (adenine2503-C2)-methyltransferase
MTYSTRLDAMDQQMPRNLLGLDLQELTAFVQEAHEPAYRARQIFHALYVERVISLDLASSLPKEFRSALAKNGVSVGAPAIQKKFVSLDGTVRYLIELSDAETVETVWMPEGDDGEGGDGSEAGEELEKHVRRWRRATICVSSQVGCAVNCQFCLTALLGVKRNLSPAEIVGQVIVVLRDQNIAPPNDRVNLVFMGMGEPFLNFENFIKAVRLLVGGVGVPESRMTVSTAGIVPRIYDLGAEPVRPKLAISLNAPNDELRTRIMPLNKKWNLEKLLTAAREFPLRNRERLTFEYVLLHGINDSDVNARELAELVRGIKTKVNLIALNPGPGIEFRTPEEVRIVEFQKILANAGVPAYVRKPRGRDIYAACGQLKRTIELAS